MADQPGGAGTSISAAAHAYQIAMSQQPGQTATVEAAEPTADAVKDSVVVPNIVERPIVCSSN